MKNLIGAQRLWKIIMKYGKTFDEIRAKINSLESVDVIHKSFSMKYSELTKYIKRYNFMAITAMGDYIKKMNVIYAEFNLQMQQNSD